MDPKYCDPSCKDPKWEPPIYGNSPIELSIVILLFWGFRTRQTMIVKADLDSQVAGNDRPLYPKIDHDMVKVALITSHGLSREVRV